MSQTTKFSTFNYSHLSTHRLIEVTVANLDFAGTKDGLLKMKAQKREIKDRLKGGDVPQDLYRRMSQLINEIDDVLDEN